MNLPCNIYQSDNFKDIGIDSQGNGLFLTLHCQGETKFLQGDDSVDFMLDFHKTLENKDGHYNADNLILEYFIR